MIGLNIGVDIAENMALIFKGRQTYICELNICEDNDDWTPMEFVVFVLMEVFNKAEEVATAIMLDVHKKGKGVAGVYSFQIAEQKVFDTLQLAKHNEFPLRASAEET